ncbi:MULTISPECIES: REP-associated tyrosine transposase [Amphritea]|uniref:REP element-mobilizing transposase RayT n=2 Tax=Amphritea TaxID=515417 RepID=A0A1H9LTV7_9GAMM|nr:MULTISPECIES: transposase [Amphritea]MBN0987758.1 transposase [Amphritea pacifica]MBN1007655.1 transposase [Amphritea pacifica]MBN1007656.1 transposase [Amphritea pacifica]SER14854.1 REP element-mobilizing transposase RayT [Amphritea atlantica]
MKGNSSALRKGRFSEAGQIYLVTFVTLQRKPVFKDFELGRLFVDVLRRESEHSETLAFVVMPDHVHWLVQLKSKLLSRTVQSVKSVSSRKIKSQIISNGPVWQDGFHDHAVRNGDDLASIARYLVMNPVRAGLVSSVKEYPLWDAVWV